MKLGFQYSTSATVKRLQTLVELRELDWFFFFLCVCFFISGQSLLDVVQVLVGWEFQAPGGAKHERRPTEVKQERWRDGEIVTAGRNQF